MSILWPADFQCVSYELFAQNSMPADLHFSLGDQQVVEFVKMQTGDRRGLILDDGRKKLAQLAG
jgi:hypothetical protein